MANKSDNDILDLSQDWGSDPNAGGVPFSGASVQKFIKGQLGDIINQVGGKFGSVTYEGGQIKFFDESGGTLLETLSISGTSYIVNIVSNVSNNFTVLTSDKNFYLRLTPSTESVEFGSTIKEEYPEDYTFKLEVDSGGGFVDRTPTNNGIRQGETTEIDIRGYLTTGVNRIRVVVTGALSGQPKTTVYTANLTSLSLNCQHRWNTVWFEGNDYKINNIYFSGNIAKTLHVKVGTIEYTQDYSASTQYVSVPTTFDLTGKTPAESGIVPIEVWITGDGVETQHFYYNIMYVASSDVNNVSLICVNEVKDKVYNFTEETLLSYAVYNVASVTTTIIGRYEDGKTWETPSNIVEVNAQTIYPLSVSLQIDTTTTDGITLDVSLVSGQTRFDGTIPVDNSNAYIPVDGARFYLNTSLGSNLTANRTTILNSSSDTKGMFKEAYTATWNGFTFSDDAWSKDPENHKALVVKAGSHISINDLRPLYYSNNDSATLEFLFRARNIADYDTPIITCINTEEYTSESVGLIVFPTRILLLGDSKRNIVFQQLPLSEDRIHHIAVVIQRGYASSSNNLARIFINGCENVTFDFDGTNMFCDNRGINSLRIGQQSTDTYLYMMRIYNKALEGSDVFKNYLNAMIETADASRLGLRDDNNILDGNALSYDLCKKAGFNAFIVETDNELPSVNNQVSYSSGINYHFEYNDYPEWNVSVYDAPCDGQGTTSKKYFFWNLRMNNKKELRWVYHNIKDEHGKTLEKTSKAGYLFGYGNDAPISKMTAKKNIASQPQGHKMGATSLYNDLFKIVMGGDEKLVNDGILPTLQSRVATKQMPFLGWQKRSDGSYTYLGLYTLGADKTDKKTFGYNETTKFPNLMMIEGPNHDPLLTRFIIPWTDDVFYDYANETLSIEGSSGTKQEGWDADIASEYSTDKQNDAQNIMNLFVSEFKPAYDAIYYYSPYIASIAETGYSNIESINSDIDNFRGGYTRGHKNELLSFYDSNYQLIYYRFKTQQYEVLPNYNARDKVGLTGNPTTDEILEARRNKWLEEVPKYVNMPEAYFRQDYDEFIGATDNDAKNSYWRKFKSIADGGKWGFNEDDLDTIFQNDNNGQDTKEYYIEPQDSNSQGVEIFQGSTSAFWYAVRLWCKNELKGMMREISDAFITLAQQLKINGNVNESVFGVISYYFWEHSSKYFPATAYNADTQKNYIDVWFLDPKALYNNVAPLTQIHGDHYETERAWVEKRIAYIFSKYQLGAFKAGDADGYGALEITPKTDFYMQVTPAIWMYPAVSVGGAEATQGERVMAGETESIKLTASGSTGVYVKALDWLADLGDLSQLELTTRGGTDIISFNLNGKRIRRVKVGDESENVKFNAVNFGVSGEAIEEIDARNVSSIEGTLNLAGCPRLRKALFGGTKLSTIYPPVGGRVTELQLPDTLTTLFLHSLALLEKEKLSLPNKEKITKLYINNCDNFDSLGLLKELYYLPNSQLNGIGIYWKGVIEDDDPNTLKMLGEIAKSVGTVGGFTGVKYNETGGLDNQDVPIIEGTIKVKYPVYRSDIDAIKAKNIAVNIIYDIEYVEFVDKEFEKLVARTPENGGYGDGIGVTQEQLDKVTSINLQNNTTVSYLNDLYKFSNLNGMNLSYSNIVEVNIPTSASWTMRISFRNMPNLEKLIISSEKITYIDQWSITDNKKLFDLVIPNSVVTIGPQALLGTALKRLVFGSGLVSCGTDNATFGGHTNGSVYIDSLKHWFEITFSQTPLTKSSTLYLGQIEAVRNPEKGNQIEYYKWDKLEGTGDYEGQGTRVKVTTEMVNEALKEVTEIKANAFKNMTQLEGELVIPNNITSIGIAAFNSCTGLTSITIPNSVTSIGGAAFYYCTNLTGHIVIPDNVSRIEQQTFDNCRKLKSVTLGTKITYIGNAAFANVTAPLICKTIVPPTLDTISVLFSPKIIYVPDEAVEGEFGYKRANGWIAFADRIKPLSEIEGISLYPLDGNVFKVTTLKATYDGIEVTPEYTIEGIAATLDGNILTFNEFGEVIVTATYNGESISRTYSWNGSLEFTSWELNKAYELGSYTEGSTWEEKVIAEQYTSGWKCAIIPITSDIKSVTINATGGTGGRLYSFVNANNIVLKLAPASYKAKNETIQIPTGCTKLIVNINASSVDPYLILNY